LILFIPTIATQIYLVANKNMIGAMDSVDAAGFFGQSDQIIKSCLALVTSIGVVMMPHVANMHSKGDEEGIYRSIIKTFNLASGISFPIFFGISAISLKFASFFLGKDFNSVGLIMIVEAPIIIFISWSAVLGTQYLLPLGRMKVFTGSVTAGAIVNILMNFLLIPFFGVIGATVATVVAELLVAVIQLFCIRNEFKIFILFGEIWKYLIAGLLMFSIVFYLNWNFKMNVLNLTVQVTVGIIVYILANALLRTQIWEMALGLVSKNK
jgi:O-antigen/teichoic acid export membrane protein